MTVTIAWWFAHLRYSSLLEKYVIERRTNQFAEGGIDMQLNTNVGVDITFEELREKHDAILIATGVYKLRELDDSTLWFSPTGMFRRWAI